MPSDSSSKIFAFTLKSPFRLDRIITECFVSVAYDTRFTSAVHPFRKLGALWDTGAVVSTIDAKVAKDLGLESVGKTAVSHAKGRDIANQFFINMRLPNGLAIPNIIVLEGNLTGFDILIGMDIIGLGDFSITNKDDKTIFSFQIPSTHDIDFAEDAKSNP